MIVVISVDFMSQISFLFYTYLLICVSKSDIPVLDDSVVKIFVVHIV